MKKILVPIDFSTNAKNALTYAANIAEHVQAELLLFHAFNAPVVDINMPGNMMASLIKEEEKLANARLKEWIQEVHAKKQYAKVRCKQLATLGFAVEEIIAASADKNVHLIVMGTQGASGLKELVIGTNTAKVIEISRVPVMVIPEKAKFSGIGKIVYASDFKAGDSSIIHQLIAFAKSFNAKIVVLHVRTSEEDNVDENLNPLLAAIHDKVDYEKLTFCVLNKEKVTEGIDEFIRKNESDVLAMATYERGVVESFFHQSITKKMAYHTPLPLLAFHKPVKNGQ